jgi:hypothetical protein
MVLSRLIVRRAACRTALGAPINAGRLPVHRDNSVAFFPVVEQSSVPGRIGNLDFGIAKHYLKLKITPWISSSP